MKYIFYKLRNFTNDDRLKIISKNIFYSILFKIGTVLITFLLIPIVLKYLGKLEYGIWLTFASLLTWFNLFDFGLANGLRNEISLHNANKQYKRTRIFVSTTYAILFLISMFFIIIFLILVNYIDINNFFNISNNIVVDLKNITRIVICLFLLRFVVQIISIILITNHLTAVSDMIVFVSNFLILICTILLSRYSKSSLLLISLNYTIIPLIVLLIFSLYFYRNKFKYLSPNIRFIKFKYSHKIFNSSIQFFIIQAASVILFTTDNFVISHVLNPGEVTLYSIAFQYFSIVIFAFNIITTPLWSSFAEAFVKKDFYWIRNIIKKVLIVWAFFVLIILFMLKFSQNFYDFWIGYHINIPFKLSLSMALFTILLTFNMIFVAFINGVGKLRVQLLSSIITIIINIPLSIYFAKYLHLGASGVMFATCVSLSYAVILRPLQCFKILNGKASGIWNK